MLKERVGKKRQRRGLEEELEDESESMRKLKGWKRTEADLMLGGKKIELLQDLKLVYSVEGLRGRVRAVKVEVERWEVQGRLVLVDKK